MRWLQSKLRNSTFIRLGSAEFSSSLLENQTEIVRRLMITAMGEFGAKHYPTIVARVHNAPGPVGLWYARTDLMAVLSSMHGEYRARRTVKDITELFRDLLPKSLAVQLRRGPAATATAPRPTD
jgi:uracil-DNA glycosylase